MNFRPPLRFLGHLTLLLAATELVPALCSVFYGEWPVVVSFLIASLITAICGALMLALGRNGGEVYRREGILIVVGGWVFASLFGALPYILTNTFSQPMDALFESASGFTTTGASVMTVIEGHARGVLFWRSFTQWLGGMGIIVLFVALLPELGPGARFLYKLIESAVANAENNFELNHQDLYVAQLEANEMPSMVNAGFIPTCLVIRMAKGYITVAIVVL